jgi:hypothetical protein
MIVDLIGIDSLIHASATGFAHSLAFSRGCEILVGNTYVHLRRLHGDDAIEGLVPRPTPLPDVRICRVHSDGLNQSVERQAYRRRVLLQYPELD